MADFQKPVAEQFLQAVLGNSPSHLLGNLWRMPPRKSLWTCDVSAALKWAGTACREQANVYCGVALCAQDRGPDKRTSNDSAAALVGFVADVDFAGAHGKKKAYPKDADQASSLILGTGLYPTIMVHSGNGLQAWWLFSQPWVFESDEERLTAIALSTAWGATLKEHARRAGVEVDSVFDLARVLRLPGTVNWKDPDNPKDVQLVFHDDKYRFNPQDFEGRLLVKPEEPEQVKRRTSTSSPSAAPTTSMGDSFPWSQHEALLANSEQYAATWARTRGDLKDGSPSGWDMALANLCVQSGLTEEQTVSVLVACRKRHGDPIKPTSYYQLTLRKALSSVDNTDVNDEELSREQRVEKIAVALAIPLTGVQKVSGTDPVYRFTFSAGDDAAERAVEIAATQLINQSTFRGKIFALTDVPPRRVGPKEHPSWDDFVKAIAQAAEVIDAGEDATVSGELYGLLEDYLAANRPIELKPQELVEHPNHPFVREGRVHFKANALLRFAMLNLGLKLTKQVLTQRLAVLQARRVTVAVKKGDGKSTGSFYAVPIGSLRELSVEDTIPEEDVEGGDDDD
jgi:hypothetical protein